MIPLGHPTYLAAKAKGDNSMWEKRRPYRRRLGKRSARLFEPQFPAMQVRRPPLTTPIPRGHQMTGLCSRNRELSTGGHWEMIPLKETNEAPKSR